MMLRTAMLAAAALAIASVSAAAQEHTPSHDDRTTAPEATQMREDDPFVLSSDACGASRYRDLVGREFAQVYQAAALPADTLIQNRTMVRTLEYTPERLNVVLGGDGRIIAVGCF
jgi:hypothetical protein